MGHYEERLETDLIGIRSLVARMGAAVEEAVRCACRAMLNGDGELASRTILGDILVNKDSRELDRKCHAFVALHVPSAGHLRYVSSVLRLSIALERIGDYAATISRTAVQLSEPPPRTVASDIQVMADQSCRLLHQAMESFNERSAERARGTLQLSGQFASTSDKVFDDLRVEGERARRPLNDLFGMLATFNRLERITHQAKNICEETIFTATGETKDPKTFDVLFLDDKNDGAGQFAEYIARKVYPEIGRYSSAGWEPSAGVDPAFVAYGEQHGLDLSEAVTSSYREELSDRLSEFEIVISLQPGARSHIAKLPFHTVLLQWNIDPALGPEEMYRAVAAALAELMETLSGTGR